MIFWSFRALALVLFGFVATYSVAGDSRPAPVAHSTGGKVTPPESRPVTDWLMRMHEASRRRAYVGTFVVTSAGNMSSARIWHVCDGQQQMERVESLTGAPRSTFRHNDQVLTFLPDAKLVRSERREASGLFPKLTLTDDRAIADHYTAQPSPVAQPDRVAGFQTDLLLLTPKDKLRFGYRIWSEKKTGLVVKLQTLDTSGNVLEQSAFSELQLDAPVRMDRLSQMMGRTEGYRVEKVQQAKTSPAAEGWSLKSPVPGFQPVHCYKRPASTQPAGDGAMQWVFSDGLAAVSLFVEIYDPQRHLQEATSAVGATQTLTRKLSLKSGDKSSDWWLTAVGEVPPATLMAFAQGLERTK